MPRKRAKESTVLDRISNLPINVIDMILSHLPLRVAVQTSTLSRKWRLHWTRLETLVIDRDFVVDIYCGKEDENTSTYVDIVGNIVLSHSGLIRKFELHVPYFEDDILDVVNRWILAVSRHGVQHLMLDYHYDYHAKVPSYLFQCTELKHLGLMFVERSPHSFEVFSSLISLGLDCRNISEDYVTNIILMCPLLEKLDVCYISKDSTFAISAPELKYFAAMYKGHTDFILKNTPNLSEVYLMLGKTDHEYGHQECPDIVDFFAAVPKIEEINLSGAVLLEWGVQDVPNMLPVPLEHHASLTVLSWQMHSPAQVRSMFCLINSSPLLQTLDISMDGPYSQPENTISYLKSQRREEKNIWSLRNVKITELMGNEPEIILIEIILSCCPLLEKLNLSSHYHLSSDTEFKMMTDIMRLPRASIQAKMIYSKSKEPPNDSPLEWLV